MAPRILPEVMGSSARGRRRTTGPLLSLLLVAACASFSPSLAAADNAAAAEALFVEGRKLLQAKDFDAACPKLAESHRLDPATGTLLALALCLEGQGKTASAWAAYSEVAARASTEKNAERERAAREQIAGLEPKLPRLVVEMNAGDRPAGLTITRDGALLGDGSLGVPIPVDPGDHVIVATATGKQTITTHVTAKAGEVARVKVGPFTDEKVTTSATTTPTAQISPPGFFTPLRTAGVAVGAVGVLGLGASGLFSALALSKKAESDKNCNGDVCDPTGLPLRKDARSLGDLATISVIAGGVLSAAGVTLVILGGPSRAPAKTGASSATSSVALAPMGMPGGAGLSLEGRFQ
ncbi:MAG: hypothetical protein U0441_11955 [Polyangiaceae bacterium]